ncbi:MAG: hypothetical protein ACI8VW_003777, partial [bacterium]
LTQMEQESTQVKADQACSEASVAIRESPRIQRLHE